ncbi:CaiB/BaiF CoA transferase family protein [Steroidobacter flavus]|uniref:CaiB/BaiF CoA transferase family protein n=1 Tax=Steroidobacter flavus TaxID=1842136 RepID=A0ABV8SZ72_9GAMM
MNPQTAPLQDLMVLDFSTLLPGPLAGLMLAEAGARVIKIERPGRGDEMRSYVPRAGDNSINFHLLNRGKQSIAIDLKAADALLRLRPLLERADVLIEQFRPGVMESLGLGYESLRKINPRLVYCSITGWGQNGPKSRVAAHDLNYMAETGTLGLSADASGAPVVPPVLAADIAGGTYPAVINILLALRQRERTGQGAYLDIAMGDALFTFAYWAIGNTVMTGESPKPGGDLVSGGSPRYRIYRTADARYIAAAPLEDKFWDNFCRLLELPLPMRAADAPAAEVVAAVQAAIGSKTAEQWRVLFTGQDVCCSIVEDVQQAMRDPHTVARGLFERTVYAEGATIPALPVPIAPMFRSQSAMASAPQLGEHSTLVQLVSDR